MLERIDQLLEESESFSFETTLSGKIYFELLGKAKQMGYGITLFFVYLNSVELAIERVYIRASKGGHSIPKDVIERRYFKGLVNFLEYSVKVNDWYIYDNSGNEYQLVAKCVDNEQKIFNFDVYNRILNR